MKKDDHEMNTEPSIDPARVSRGDTPRLDALLAEYSYLRKESIAAVGYRVQIMAFTFAALSVLVAALLTRNVPDLLAGILSVFVVPQIAKGALLMWLGEYSRSARAGRYLRRIEQDVNTLLGAKTLGWEKNLVREHKHMFFPYVAPAFVILANGYLASGLGVYLLSMGSRQSPNWILLIGLLCYVAVLEAVFIGFFCHLWDRIRKQ